MIRLEITTETAAELRAHIAELAGITGSEPKVIAPAADTPKPVEPMQSSASTPDEKPSSDPSPTLCEETPNERPTANISSEPVKRGRGRPRKDAAPVATQPTSDAANTDDRGNALEDAGNAPTPAPQGGATEADTPATESASASSSGGELAPVTDADLQRYCARLAQHYGSPAKVFELASAYVPEGQPSRPSSIQGDEQRWAFIAAAEADSGLKYHG